MSYKMHNYKRLPMISLGRKVLGAAVASSLLLLSNAHATGLGRLTVLSALGQPLRAEIELTSPNKDEVSSLVPKLASADAFKQASIDFNPALLSMRFTVEARGTGYVIRVTSTQAMNEPFVDMLLEMNSSSGRLLREYTFLLDPAELRNSQSAQVANPVNIATAAPVAPAAKYSPQQTSQGEVAAVSSASQKKVLAKQQDVRKETVGSGDYKVKSGDTLSKVAGEYRNEGVSLDQMLAGLYKANPQAFSGNNMNRLRVGQILTIPDAGSIQASSKSESHSLVMAHAADFNSYRNKLAGQVAEAPAQKAATSKQAVSGTITTKVKEIPTATSEALDKLKLSKAAPSATAKSGIGNAAAEEDKLAKDKAIADANARVKELEKNVGELNKLLKIKDKDLAEKQAAATKIDTKPAGSKELAASSAVSAEASAKASAEVTASSTPVTKQVSASAVAVAPKRKAAAPPPPEPSFIDSIMDSGLVLPVGVLAALVAGYGIFSSRRKKKLQHFDDSILTGSSMKANSMFGSTGGQSVDTNNSVFNSNFAPSASQLDANEVDPIAEADVYIAYGRDTQAEEILKEALRTQPDRHAVRVKLLEIYYNRKDPRSFERLASELYGMTSGEGDEWAQAASMGVVLEPTNPLYAGGKAQVDMSSGADLDVSTQPLEDLDPEALLGNSLSDDMLESISIIDTASGLTEDVTSEAEPMSAKASEAESFDIGSLDFDLDIPNSEEPAQFEAPLLPDSSVTVNDVSSQVSTEDNPVVDFGTIDFDLGASDADSTPSVEQTEKSTLASLGLEQMNADTDLNHIDFDSAVTSETMTSLNSIEIPGEENLTSATESVETKPEVQSAAYEFDLSGIDLDLNSADDEIKTDSAAPQMADESYNAEMATKLDLAVAYHEIGDKEGARELLDEVLKGGTSDQIEKAKSMLAQLI